MEPENYGFPSSESPLRIKAPCSWFHVTFPKWPEKIKKNLWYELPVPAVRNLVILMVTTTGLLFQRCNDSEFPTFCSGRKQVTPQKNSPCWYHSPKVHFQKKLAVMKIYDFDNWHVWLGKRNLLKNKQETTLAAKTQPGLPWTFWRNQFRGLCEEIGKGTWNHRKPGLPTGVFNVNSTIFYRNLNDMSFFRALYIYMYINIYLKKNIFLVYIYIYVYMMMILLLQLHHLVLNMSFSTSEKWFLFPAPFHPSILRLTTSTLPKEPQRLNLPPKLLPKSPRYGSTLVAGSLWVDYVSNGSL